MPSSTSGLEEDDEDEELLELLLGAVPGEGQGPGSFWGTAAGGWAGGPKTGAPRLCTAATCCRSSETARSSMKTCSKASWAVAGMYPSGIVTICHAQTRCTRVLFGRALLSAAMVSNSCASGKGSARPSSDARCCKVCNACTKAAGCTGEAWRRTSRARCHSGA